MERFQCERGEVLMREAWTASEIRESVDHLLNHFAPRFPKRIGSISAPYQYMERGRVIRIDLVGWEMT